MSLDILTLTTIWTPFPRSSAGGLAVDLLEAVVAWLKADAGLVALLPGGIHGDEAPPRIALPYAVISEPSGSAGFESGGGGVDSAELQVSIFAAGKAEARVARRRLVASLRDAPLAFAGGSLLQLRDSTRGGMHDPDKGPGGCEVFQDIQNFQAVVGRG